MGRTTILRMVRAGSEERCENREAVVKVLYEVLDWVNKNMTPDESADVYITIHVPYDELHN